MIAYRWFIFILFAGAMLSLVLAIWRLLQSSTLYPRSSPLFSWFAVPLPFLIAWVVVTYKWVWLVIKFHE